MVDGLMKGFRALDLTDEKGFVCGQILATLGVDVIKVEKPGGDTARNIPPYYHNVPDPENSLYWSAFNTNKRGITLNLETGWGRELFKKLVITADFVLESSTPGYLNGLGIGYEALSRVNERIILTSITHFGQKGPHSHYKGSELVDSAMSGVLENTGYPDRPPVREALDSVYFHANAAAALGTLMSHYSRELSNKGQQVDISIQEVAASRTTLGLLAWQWDKRLIKRGGPMGQIGFRPFRWIWPCQDGHIFWFFLGGQTGAPANRALSQWIDEDGLENPLREVTNWEDLDMVALPQHTLEAFQETIGSFFLKHTKKEIAGESLNRGINAVIASDPADVLENSHLAARDFWTDLAYSGSGRTLTYPSYFFRFSEADNHIVRPAPIIGQDNDKIYRNELGLSSTDMAALKEADVI